MALFRSESAYALDWANNGCQRVRLVSDGWHAATRVSSPWNRHRNEDLANPGPSGDRGADQKRERRQACRRI